MPQRSVLETLVIQVVGEFRSYRNMMRQIPRIAGQAAIKTAAKFSVLDKTIARVANHLDAVGTRSMRRFTVGVGRGIQATQRGLKTLEIQARKMANRGGILFEALLGRRAMRAGARMGWRQQEFMLFGRKNLGGFARNYGRMWKDFAGVAGLAGLNMMSGAGGMGAKGMRGLDAFLGGIAARVDRFGTRLQRKFQLLPRKLAAWAPMAAMAGMGFGRRLGRMGVGAATLGAGALGALGGRVSGFGRGMLNRFPVHRMPFWQYMMFAMNPRMTLTKTWQDFKQGTAGRFGRNQIAQAAAYRGHQAGFGLRSAGAAIGRGARGLGALGLAGGAMALRGGRAALPMLGRAGRMAGVGAMGAMGLMGRSIHSVFIPAMTAAQRATSLWYARFRNYIRRLGYDMGFLGRRITMYVTAPLAAFGTFAAYQFAKFDDAMTTSMSLLEQVGPTTRKAMEEAVFAISSKSRTGPLELAQSYFYLASAGFEAEESIKALAVVERFALAGAFDLSSGTNAMNSATTHLVDTMSALGLRTGNVEQDIQNMIHVSDVLTKANIIANATVEDFAKSLTNKGGAALRLVNKDIEEGTAVLAAYAMQGVKAETAGEKLYIILRDLARAAIKKPAEFQSVGIRVFDNGKMRPIVAIIEDIEKAFSNMSDEQKRATFMQLGFQDRSVAATMQLINMSHHIRQFEAQLRQAGGTTELVANRRLKSFTSQMMITWNQLKIMAIGIGRLLLPNMLAFFGAIRDGIKLWNSLDTVTQKWVIYLAMVVALIGPIVTGLGLLATLLETAFSGLILIKALFLAWGPFVGTVIAVVGAVIALAYVLIGPEGLVGAWKKATEWAGNFVRQVIGFFENFSANMVILWTWFRSNWKAILSDSALMFLVFTSNMIINFQVGIETLVRIIGAFIGWVVGQWERGFDTEFGKWMFAGIKRAAKMLAKWGMHARKILLSIWSGEEVDTDTFLDKLFADVKSAATHQTFQQLIDQIKGIYEEGVGRLRTPLQGMEFATPEGPKFLTDIPKEIEDNVTNPVKGLATTLGDLHDEMDEPFEANFSVKGVEAVQAGSVEALSRLMEFRALKGTQVAKAVVPAAAAVEDPEVARVRALGEKLGRLEGSAVRGFGGGKDLPSHLNPFEFNSKGIRADSVEEILSNIDKNIEEQKEYIEKNPNPFTTFLPSSIGSGT